jgi:hypothetical protein
MAQIPKYSSPSNNNVDHPASQYVTSKKANELMAHIYSHFYRLPTTGLRFYSIRIEVMIITDGTLLVGITLPRDSQCH